MEEIQITTYEGAAEELARRLVNLYELKIFPRQGKIFADMLCEACAKGGSYLNSLGEIDNKIAKRDIAQDALIEIKRADYLLEIMRVGNYYTESEIRELSEYIKQIIKLLTDLLVVAYEQTMTADVRIIQPILQGKIQPALAQPPKVSLLSDGAPFGVDSLMSNDGNKAAKEDEAKLEAEAAATKPEEKSVERNNIKADDIIVDNRTMKEKRRDKKVDKNAAEFSARMTETTSNEDEAAQNSGEDNPTEE